MVVVERRHRAHAGPVDSGYGQSVGHTVGFDGQDVDGELFVQVYGEVFCCAADVYIN